MHTSGYDGSQLFSDSTIILTKVILWKRFICMNGKQTKEYNSSRLSSAQKMKKKMIQNTSDVAGHCLTVCNTK